jgi:hypothetical protein
MCTRTQIDKILKSSTFAGEKATWRTPGPDGTTRTCVPAA